MPRTFKLPAGTSFPATLADYKLKKAGKPCKRVTASGTVEAPYEEIIPSWLANGVQEVSPRGVPKR